jgi:hypothetical protein
LYRRKFSIVLKMSGSVLIIACLTTPLKAESLYVPEK